VHWNLGCCRSHQCQPCEMLCVLGCGYHCSCTAPAYIIVSFTCKDVCWQLQVQEDAADCRLRSDLLLITSNDTLELQNRFYAYVNNLCALSGSLLSCWHARNGIRLVTTTLRNPLSRSRLAFQPLLSALFNRQKQGKARSRTAGVSVLRCARFQAWFGTVDQATVVRSTTQGG